MSVTIKHLAKVIVHQSDGRLLIVRRSHTAPHRAFEWEFPGGMVDKGESAESAAYREVAEETGIILRDMQLIKEVRAELLPEWVAHVFSHTMPTNDEVKLSFEHDMFKWVTVAQANAHFKHPLSFEALRLYIPFAQDNSLVVK